ncbi:MAG: response regulator [Candidatus Sumerlaeia bacterium]
MAGAKEKAIRVMVVDDHPIVRDGIKANLEDADIITVIAEASNGEEALALAEETKPDVIVMDMKLPDMNGLEATEKLREKLPSAKVVILSMYDDKNYVLQSVRRGARGYLLKDSSAEDLVNAIAQIHRGGAFFDPEVTDFLLNPDADDDIENVELSSREREVLTLIAEGLSNKEIASKLFLSVRTIEAHRENIMRKLSIHGTAALTKYAIENGYIQVDIHPETPDI